MNLHRFLILFFVFPLTRLSFAIFVRRSSLWDPIKYSLFFYFVDCSSVLNPLKKSLSQAKSRVRLHYERLRQGNRNPEINVGDDSSDDDDDNESDDLYDDSDDPFESARETLDPEVRSRDLTQMTPNGSSFAGEEEGWKTWSVVARNMGTRMRMNATRVIFEIGFWLRDHKFMETKDPRFCAEEFRDKLLDESVKVEVCADRLKNASYVRHFPLPRLRRENQALRIACRKGLLPCIDEIQSKLFNTTLHFSGNGALVQMERLLGYDKLFDEDIYRPFRNHLEWFQYRVTASYYMCYFTLYGHPLLRRFGRPCRREVFELGRHLRRMNDYRTEDDDDYDCALLSFCPDPCCGAIPSTNPGVDPPGQAYEEAVCRMAPSNPCFGVADGACRLPPDENLDFEMLKRNFMNYSCDCKREYSGLNLKWEMSLKRCLDVDECFESERLCEGRNEVCVNTFGSYACACRMGFVRTNGSCQRMPWRRKLEPTFSTPPTAPHLPPSDSPFVVGVKRFFVSVAKFLGLDLPPEIKRRKGRGK